MFMECRQLPLFYFILPGKMYFLKSYVDHLYELLFYHLQVKFFFAPNALELSQARAKSAVLSWPLLTVLSVP